MSLFLMSLWEVRSFAAGYTGIFAWSTLSWLNVTGKMICTSCSCFFTLPTSTSVSWHFTGFDGSTWIPVVETIFHLNPTGVHIWGSMSCSVVTSLWAIGPGCLKKNKLSWYRWGNYCGIVFLYCVIMVGLCRSKFICCYYLLGFCKYHSLASFWQRAWLLPSAIILGVRENWPLNDLFAVMAVRSWRSAVTEMKSLSINNKRFRVSQGSGARVNAVKISKQCSSLLCSSVSQHKEGATFCCVVRFP